MDRGVHQNLKNWTLKEASRHGFNIEVLAFSEERGQMLDRVKLNDPVGIVQFRNEFSHGKAYRATEKIGETIISDTFLLAQHFNELITLSYAFAAEVSRFRGLGVAQNIPRNPFDH